jgi:N-acetylglucosamine-6-sulfatase
VLLLLCVAAAGVFVVARTPAAGRLAPPDGGPPPTIDPLPPHPDIVFVLTDDLSMDLLRYMPEVRRLQRDGLTFDDYFVADSLCCPSRASILTGNFPHDTHVFNNTGRRGGFSVFHRRGEERHTFAVALRAAGYRTALMGKYLNGYMQSVRKGGDPDVPDTFVPPGWSEWDVGGWGYPEFDYTLNEDGELQHYGSAPDDYLTDVIARRGVDFIDSAAASGRPFFLELSTFAPHAPYVPAPRDADLFPGLRAPEPPNFDRLPTHPPLWLRDRPPLNREQIAEIDEAFRLRVQDVQAIDDLIAEIRRALTADGIAADTYVVFSSDNGLHTGEYRLMPGKLTAFDTDIHVPLIVAGPGVPVGASTNAMAENVDLARTFAQIGGSHMATDGHSLLPLLDGERQPDWRNAILVEHDGKALNPSDPDFQQPASGNPNSYEAIRTHRFLYVEYRQRHEHEFYDLRSDPYELHNVYGTLSPLERAVLHDELERIKHCHTGRACWQAMHVSAHVPP